jgi:hypothetical protein
MSIVNESPDHWLRQKGALVKPLTPPPPLKNVFFTNDFYLKMGMKYVY